MGAGDVNKAAVGVFDVLHGGRCVRIGATVRARATQVTTVSEREHLSCKNPTGQTEAVKPWTNGLATGAITRTVCNDDSVVVGHGNARCVGNGGDER